VAAALIECVPNVSEGRDGAAIDAITAAVQQVQSVHLLDRHIDGDHNRTVLTFAGEPGAVLEGALAAARQAVARIDLTRQRGEHPRIGAIDVIPFVPLQGATLQDCAALAKQAGEAIWKELGVPVYLYEAAAQCAERRDLAYVRRGQIETLRQQVGVNPERTPDIGEPRLHPTAGAVAVGARGILVAFNVNLDTSDVQVAREIARRVRASGGGLPAVKALGVYLALRNRAQVTMNLVDYSVTSPRMAWDAVKDEAQRLGVEVSESEIVGLIPSAALPPEDAAVMNIGNLHPGAILEDRLAAAGFDLSAAPWARVRP
jgi:glutamate formiminotransferase